MNCEICGREVCGTIDITEEELAAGAWAIFLRATPDRDWIACDSCNKVVCHDCCEHPRTGYCDTCIDKYNLLSELEFVENCGIEELEDFLEAKQGTGKETKRKGRFMQDEAKSKLDKTIRSLVEFAGVPKGTTGRVVAIDYLRDGWDVVIEWNLPKPARSAMMSEIAGAPVLIVNTGKPLRDWFTREEYEKYLEEI